MLENLQSTLPSVYRKKADAEKQCLEIGAQKNVLRAACAYVIRVPMGVTAHGSHNGIMLQKVSHFK